MAYLCMKVKDTKFKRGIRPQLASAPRHSRDKESDMVRDGGMDQNMNRTARSRIGRNKRLDTHYSRHFNIEQQNQKSYLVAKKTQTD